MDCAGLPRTIVFGGGGLVTGVTLEDVDKYRDEGNARH
jgi:hypothetical protein